jgi:23S rRNA (cytosine1962-C5)-methyltransferase
VLDGLHALGFDGVYLKVRPRQANTLVDTRREDLAPRLPVRGVPADEELVVVEEGVPYAVRLGDGLSTGIFLDQRANRARVRQWSGGARVLNLFAYTCAFSVVAALGGARATVSVDASAAALERGRANLALSGIDPAGHTFVADDAFGWLARVAKKPPCEATRFELVVLDPPSYSTTRSRRFVASSDFAELVEAATRVLAPHGRLLASTNHRGIARKKLRYAVSEGVRRAGRTLDKLKDLADPLDFPAAAGDEPHMKSVVATVL